MKPLTDALRSLWAWGATFLLMLAWCPFLALIRVLDRDPVRYRTGRWFRRLGAAMVRVNPAWRLHVSGEMVPDPRRPYVVVCNHQSHADIPLISCLPWEMKWLAKTELFRLPVIGWMLRLAGDIPVDRQDRRRAAQALIRARWYLQNRCSVMFFPEGTRSPDAHVHEFKDGAFHIAIQEQVPVLPLAIDGSFDCLPKHSWIFGKPSDVRLEVLPPVETTGMTKGDVQTLNAQVRGAIISRVAAWRKCESPDVQS